jgi:hypothetical protein
MLTLDDFCKYENSLFPCLTSEYKKCIVLRPQKMQSIFANAIRALSPALAVKFNISSGRWQHFPLWPLFLQREKGKRTEMTGTQHVGTLKYQFIHYSTIKMVLVFFH